MDRQEPKPTQRKRVRTETRIMPSYGGSGRPAPFAHKPLMTPPEPVPKLGWEGWTLPLHPELQRLRRMQGQERKMSARQEELASKHPFMMKARPAQVPPCTDWKTWLFMGGRGAGKTRAGAELVRYAVEEMGYRRIALVAPTLHDAREVMVMGVSGLMSLESKGLTPPHFEPSRRRLVWKNGAEAYLFSAEDPDSLRGPQFDLAWCDEIAAWARGQETWDMLQMALRLGPNPRVLATTTPRPVPLVRGLVGQRSVTVTRSASHENADNLAPGFIAHIEQNYGGTALGRQELYGELLDDPEGAMFVRGKIDAMRIWEGPAQFDDVVVAVDPPASSGAKADACGIVAAGQSAGRTYVLGDASARGLAPLDWARAAVALAVQSGASRIIAEANQGGEMVRETLTTAGCRVPVELVHARLGKRGRAAPVAAAYAQGMVAHIGRFDALEDEMCAFGAPGFTGSPDRLDALVWAVWALRNGGAGPRVRML